jgi:hypothetical protein
LAVAELLAGLGRIIREREHVKIYWIAIAWMILATLALTNSWWAVWAFRMHPFESYFQFLSLVFPSLIFVVIAFLISPPIEPGRAFDLRAYYFRQIRWVAPLFAVQMTGLALSHWVLGFESLFAPLNVIRLGVIAAILSLGFSTQEKLHGAAVATVATLFVLAVALSELGGG